LLWLHSIPMPTLTATSAATTRTGTGTRGEDVVGYHWEIVYVRIPL
jgi:hypothetical protein